MESLIKELKNNKVLGKEDIISLRNQINEANPYANSKKKASLLSFAIYKTIDESLEGFSDKYKEKIRQKLIITLAFDNKELIDKSDIFFTSTRFEEDCYELLEDITRWVNNNAKDIVKKEVIDNYIRYNSEISVVSLKKSKNLSNRQKNYRKLNSLKQMIFNNEDNRKKLFMICVAILFILLATVKSTDLLNGYFIQSYDYKPVFSDNADSTLSINQNKLVLLEDVGKESYEKAMNKKYFHIPSELRYRDIDEHMLKEYLKTRNSILEEEPYFSAIIDTAREFNLNPIALFSITGQEQGFVPRDHSYSQIIANNPFNVYGSWKKYNTNVKDSSEIAARTVSNLLKGKPKDMDPFQWINRKYAEDKKWWVGVRILFDQITEAVER